MCGGKRSLQAVPLVMLARCYIRAIGQVQARRIVRRLIGKLITLKASVNSRFRNKKEGRLRPRMLCKG